MNSAKHSPYGIGAPYRRRENVVYPGHTGPVMDPLSFRASAAARLVAFVLLLALVATGCGEAARPTLTADQVPGPNASETTDQTVVGAGTTPPPATASETTGGGAEGDTAAVEQLVVQVMDSFPHDESAFTQGLELYEGTFIESTGLYGESELRRVDPATGEVQQSVPIPAEFFAEGVTRVGDRLVQLTWQENTAFYWDLETFERVQDVGYSGEGWGLCFDGDRLVMTDGTPVLIFRDPATFDEIGRTPVTLDGEAVFNLNEVECVDGVVWANIWQTDLIVRIDPTSGQVTGVVDAAALDSPDEPNGAVLNGIAWDEATRSFYVTGKFWPTMYRVEFVPAATG